MNVKEYQEFILEKLEHLHLFSRPMMGGYLFYYNNLLFGGIYENNNFLIKLTKGNESYDLPLEAPYASGKLMYYIEPDFDSDFVTQLILDTCSDLKPIKK